MIEWAVGLSVPEQWIYGIIFSGIIAIVVQWFSQRLCHALAIGREQHKDIIGARKKLRSVFTPTHARIKLIPPDSGIAVYNIIRELIPAHANAVEEFRSFVPKRKRDKYQKAWEEYRRIATQGSPATQGEAWGRGMTVTALFEEKIHGILAFTEK